MEKLVLGMEAEGMFRGVLSVFVIGNINTDELISVLRKYKVEQVYFGAGDCSKVDINSLRKVWNEKLCHILTVEIGKKNYSPELVEAIVNLDNNGLVLHIMLTFSNYSELFSLLDWKWFIEKMKNRNSRCCILSLKQVVNTEVYVISFDSAGLQSFIRNSLDDELYSLDKELLPEKENR